MVPTVWENLTFRGVEEENLVCVPILPEPPDLCQNNLARETGYPSTPIL